MDTMVSFGDFSKKIAVFLDEKFHFMKIFKLMMNPSSAWLGSARIQLELEDFQLGSSVARH